MTYLVYGIFIVLGLGLLFAALIWVYRLAFNKGVDSIVSRLSRECLENLYRQLDEEFKKEIQNRQQKPASSHHTGVAR